MNNVIPANELKIKGVSALEPILSQGLEAVITVRGKMTYVVMTQEEYSRLRENELSLALLEAQADINSGNFSQGSIEEHVSRISHA